MNNEIEMSNQIIAMERIALERWGKGDPSGFLEISSPEVVYFDPFITHRIDGLKELTDYYETIRGKIWIDSDEIINPKVQICGDIAVLTFNYSSFSGGIQMLWNCTEVYQRKSDHWSIIQSHWSITKP